MPGNLVDRGPWWTIIHGVAKESDKTEQPNNNKERDSPGQRFCLCSGRCAHSGTSRVWAVTNSGEEINCLLLDVKSQKLNLVFNHWNLSKVLGVKMAFEISHTWSSTIILFIVPKRIGQHFITLYSELTEKNIELICFQRHFVRTNKQKKPLMLVSNGHHENMSKCVSYLCHSHLLWFVYTGLSHDFKME